MVKIEVRIQVNSSQQKIILVSNNKYKVYLHKPPIENKANEELIKLLKKYFKADVEILKGHNSRTKMVEIKNGN